MDTHSAIVLASTSPRRIELLSDAGLVFSKVAPGVDETPLDNEGPKEMVERLALLKASGVADTMPSAFVIGADTTVFIDGASLGKPTSESDAATMLERIQGRTHEVWGGIAVINRERGIARVWSDMTQVRMCNMSSSEIARYIKTGEPLDKAGAYAIQGIGLQFVSSIVGSYSNVVGLNIAQVLAELRLLGALD
jgi:septum formation protein